jgi:hypothetical protein
MNAEARVQIDLYASLGEAFKIIAVLTVNFSHRSI